MSDEDLPPTHQPWGSKPDPQASSPEPPAAPPPPQPGPRAAYTPPPNPYPEPGSFDQYTAPNPYGAQPYGAYPPGYGGALPPEHPSATTGMVLGIVGLVGIMTCGGITLVLSPFAWAIGGRAVREIDASPGRYRGREKANAGRIMGIIGTVLLALGVLVIAAFIVVAIAVTPDTTHIGPNTPAPHHHGLANS